VVLRVTIENNTINTGIAVGGVPGIDTQRMQSEVLVPDGGTTIMAVCWRIRKQHNQQDAWTRLHPDRWQSVQAQTGYQIEQ